MGIFSKIRDAILPGSVTKKDEPKVAPKTGGGFGADAAPRTTTTTAPQNASVTENDVEARLERMQGSDKLNWRTSIVDLMKLVGIDSSYENRKELAHELGNTSYTGSAEDNVWLHKATMRELAKNGGRVPASMMD